MDEKTTVAELRKEKKAELKAVLRTMGKLEIAKVATMHRDMQIHLGVVRDLDKLYLRRKALMNFIKELNGDHRLILSVEDVLESESREDTK